MDTWLKMKDEEDSSPVFKIIDWDKLLVAGHSRGAKLATLLYSGFQ